MKRQLSGLLYLNGHALLNRRHNIAIGGINFLHGVIAAYQDVLEGSHALSVGHSGLIYRDAGKRCASQLEGDALYQTVLGSLGDLQITAFQRVMDLDLGGLTQLHLYAGNHFGNDVFLSRIDFLYGIVVADKHVFKCGYALIVGGGGHVYRFTVSGCASQAELNAFHIAVLRGLGDFHGATGQLVLERQLSRLFQLDRYTLLDRRNDIAIGCIDFLHGVIVANKNIFEGRYTLAVGNSRLAYRRAGSGSASKLESDALNQTIFSSLCDLQIAALEGVVYVYLSGGVQRHLDVGNHFRNHVFIGGIDFLNSIVAANKHILERGYTLIIGNSRHIHGFTAGRSTGKPELDTLNQTILRGLGDLYGATSQFVFKLCLSRDAIGNDNAILDGRHYIFRRSIQLLQRIVAANRYILNQSDTVTSGSSGKAHVGASRGSTCQLKGNALNHAVFSGFCDLHRAFFQNVFKRDRLDVADTKRYSLRRSWDVVVRCVFRDRVSTGLQIRNGDLTV